MIKAQILSDLHFEFHADFGRSFVKSLDPSNVDVLILAGDLSSLNILANSLYLVCEHFKHVVYVPGNHEYYGAPAKRDVEDIINHVAKYYKNFHPLKVNEVIEISGQRFIGCTLWFAFDQLNTMFKHCLSDFEQIKDFEDWVYKDNVRSQNWLAQHVKPDDIVITHHLPSFKSVADEFKNSNLNRFFVCDMERTIAFNRPKLWVHGHTHRSCDYTFIDTRVICNPLGYVGHDENTSFDDKLIMEV